MKKTSKILSILLVIAMMLTMAPFSFIAGAASVVASGTLGQYDKTAWTIYDNGLLVIDGKGNSISTKWDSTTASPWKDYADIITRVSFVNCENWECIPECTFRSLSNLKDVTLPENIEEICQYAFTGTAIETIILPDGLITIGYYAFSSCESLKYININDGVTSIGSSAFYNCSSLKAISIPDSVTSIGQMLFQNCTNLEYVRLSGNADKVSGSMFFGCTMLKNVSLPASVTVIGSKAFSNASNLEGVYYHGINEPTTYNPGINNATFSLAPDTMMIYASNDYSGTTMGLKANWENDVQTVTKIDGYFVNVAHTIGGAVKVNKSIVPVGDTVTLDFMAYKNYALDTLTVTDAEDNEITLNGDGNTRTFAMPEGDVTITATFKSTIVPHVHDWTFEVDGTSIKATCANTDGACHNPYQSVVMTKPSSTSFFWNLERTVTVSGTIEDVEIPEVVYTLKSTGEGARPFEPGVYVASLTIEGVTATCEYEITKAVIDYTYFDYIAPENLVYDGTPKVAAVVPHDRVAIYIGDVEVLYNGSATPPTNVGSYTVKLNVAESDYYKANSNLSLGGRGGKSFSIVAKDVGDLTYTGLVESYPMGATPDVTIQYNGMTLVKDTDYTVEYADNTEPGTATMTIAGIGNYTGTKTLEFEILDHTHSFTYTASGNMIVAVCTADGCPLENGDGGYVTISAPADTCTDGNAVVDNQLADKSTVVNVVYSTDDGSAPTVDGTYTANITLGNATATVKFTLGHDYDYENGVLTRPTDSAKGYYTYTCKNDSNHTITEEVESADYTEYDKAVKKIEGYFTNPNLTNEAKYLINEEVEKFAQDNSEYCDQYGNLRRDLIASEQKIIDDATGKANELIQYVDGLMANCEAGNHDVRAYTSDNNATCTQDGTKRGNCYVCGTEVVVTDENNLAFGHDMIIDEAVEPTCTETGLTEGSHCSRCDDVTTEQEVVPELGHDMVTDEAVEPTCTETGLTEGSHCSRCDGATTEQQVVPELGHDMVTDEAVEPTCTETGLTEGSHCSRCDDATTEQDVIPELGHDMVTDEAVEPTCTETGLTEGSHCSRCDGATTEQQVVPELGHDMVTDEAVEPTCTETGLTEGSHCSRCDGATTEQQVVPELGHDMVTDEAVEPNCTETGLTEGSHCSRCDGATTEQEIVPALGHTPLDAVEENYVAPTCETAGSKDIVVYCEVCDGEISRETETIDATGHNDSDNDGCCDDCDEQLCNHACHKKGIRGFFWKIIRFFYRLLNIQQYCDCGNLHYENSIFGKK